jgi:two-component system, NarL family, response regulator NreC
MAEPTRIVLADDHGIFRSGLRALLSMEPDMEVVGEASSAPEALASCVQLMPDVLVLDLMMPPGPSGLEVLPRILGECPGLRVLVLTMLPEEQYLFQVLKAGGLGYIPKSGADTELVEALRVVRDGRVYLHPRDMHLILSGYAADDRGRQDPDLLGTLSPREREVLELTARGHSSREIAERLIVSPKTVDTYRQRLMDKLGLERRSELISFAVRRGLLRDEPSDKP